MSDYERRRWGWIRKRSSGRYQASYVGPDGVRYVAPTTFELKIDAEEWLTQQRDAIDSAAWYPLPTRQQVAEEYRQRRNAEDQKRHNIREFERATKLPTVAVPLGYLYVVEVVERVCKIGITTEPARRLKTLKREAQGYGLEIGRVWISEPHTAHRKHERELIRFGGIDNRREYLQLPFTKVSAFAQTLVSAE